MYRLKKKFIILCIGLVLALFVFILYLYSINFFYWIPMYSEREGLNIEYIKYQENTYIYDPQEQLEWACYSIYGDSMEHLGWGKYWLYTYYSNRRDNPMYISSPRIGVSIVFFREDIDVFQESLIVYDGTDFERKGIEIQLATLIQKEPIEIMPYFELMEDVDYFIVNVQMKNSPNLIKSMSVFEFEGRFYICLDYESEKYKDKYYPLSDEYAKAFCEFYGIDFES